MLLGEHGERLRGRRCDLDLVQREERVELVDDPGVELELVGRRARQLLEGGLDLRIPEGLEREALAGDAAGEDQPRRRRLLAVLERLEAAAGAEAEPRVAQLGRARPRPPA